MKASTEWETTRRQVTMGGRVLDDGDKPVRGAAVTVTARPAEAPSEEGGHTWAGYLAKADGIYYFLDLPAGTYTVRAVHGRSGAVGEETVSVPPSEDGRVRMAVADVKLSKAARGG